MIYAEYEVITSTDREAFYRPVRAMALKLRNLYCRNRIFIAAAAVGAHDAAEADLRRRH